MVPAGTRNYPRQIKLLHIQGIQMGTRMVSALESPVHDDWKNAIVTIDPRYYKWNQWLFLTLREQGLVYRKDARVQWCPSCKTALANEQVLEERCWRCQERVLGRHLQ